MASWSEDSDDIQKTCGDEGHAKASRPPNGSNYREECGACMLMLVSCMIKQLITDLDIDLMFALKA